jgi:hypothetical protein
LKSLWAKLYAWAFPCALTFGAYGIFVYPRTTFGHEWLDHTTDTEKITIFAAVTLSAAFILNAFSTPLYRVLEGYLLWPSYFQQLGVNIQLRRKRKLTSSIATGGWRRGIDLEKLALYPKRDAQVVPTRFGNAIRSFETYGKTRFNLDTQTLWYELHAVVPKYLQTEYTDARSAVDFFVALIYLSAGLGIATLVIAAFEQFDSSLVITGFVSLMATVACHWLAVRATREWSYTVQAIVNIGRAKLADGIGLELPRSLEKEKEMWGLLTKYTYYAYEIDGQRLDEFRKKIATATCAGVKDKLSLEEGGSDTSEEGGDDTLQEVDSETSQDAGEN